MFPICVVVLLLFSVVAYAIQPGFQATLGQAGFQTTIDHFLPPLVAKIQGLHLPDINGKQSSFEYHVTNIRITQCTYKSAVVGLKNHLSFDLNNLHVHIALNWKYRESIWPHIPNGSGGADVDANNVHIGVALSATVTPSGRITLKADSVAANLNSVSIKTHGSLFSWLYNIIIDLFKNTLKSAAEKALHDALGSAITVQANNILATFPFVIPLDSTADLDYHLTGPPIYPEQRYIQQDFVGAIMPKGGSPPNLPRHGIAQYRSGKMVDLVADQYFFDSAIDTYHRAGLFNWLITPANLPSNSPIKLNTSDFAILFPLLFQKYPNRAMQVHIVAVTKPTLSFSSDVQKIDVPLTATVLIDSNGQGNFTQAFVLQVSAGGSLEASIKQTSIFLKVDTLVFSLKVISSNIGPFDENIFDLLVNVAINLVILPAVIKL